MVTQRSAEIVLPVIVQFRRFELEPDEDLVRFQLLDVLHREFQMHIMVGDVGALGAARYVELDGEDLLAGGVREKGRNGDEIADRPLARGEGRTGEGVDAEIERHFLGLVVLVVIAAAAIFHDLRGELDVLGIGAAGTETDQLGGVFDHRDAGTGGGLFLDENLASRQGQHGHTDGGAGQSTRQNGHTYLHKSDSDIGGDFREQLQPAQAHSRTFSWRSTPKFPTKSSKPSWPFTISAQSPPAKASPKVSKIPTSCCRPPKAVSSSPF